MRINVLVRDSQAVIEMSDKGVKRDLTVDGISEVGVGYNAKPDRQLLEGKYLHLLFRNALPVTPTENDSIRRLEAMLSEFSLSSAVHDRTIYERRNEYYVVGIPQESDITIRH